MFHMTVGRDDGLLHYSRMLWGYPRTRSKLGLCGACPGALKDENLIKAHNR